MPITPTYPGVYIEEIPSGVRTITGVATSIAAFVGYTARGPLNEAVRVLSYADFERNFGGLDRDSEVGYAVQQFFGNGGTDAYVVRTATGVAVADVVLEHAGGQDALLVTAANAGAWANLVRLDVDYATTNPDSTFNLAVNRYELQDEDLVLAETELHRNLSMNSRSGSYAVNVVNSASKLIRLQRPAGLAFADRGFSRSGELGTFALQPDEATISGMLNGATPFTLTLTAPLPTDAASLVTRLTAAISTAGLSNRLDVQRVDALGTASTTGNHVQLTSQNVAGNPDTAPEFSSVQVTSASPKLKLGLANGGREKEGASFRRPAQTGTSSADLADRMGQNVGAATTVRIKIVDNSTTPAQDILADTDITSLGSANLGSVQIGPGLAVALQEAIRAIPNPAAAQATVQLNGTFLRVVPGASSPNASIQFTAGGAQTGLRMTSAAGGLENVQQYSLGTGADFGAQSGATSGADGSPPNGNDLIGSFEDKTGIYALRDVDLFNIMAIPRTTGLGGDEARSVIQAAITFCAERRAFYIVDPDPTRTLTDIGDWVSELGASKNAAVYFPRVMVADPLDGFRTHDMPASGAIAGVYARTDGERGVWKAPAGIDATLRGVQGLSYVLTDGENGTLNPLGINSLRTFPVFGTVIWGARTLEGADQRASEWKYVPVRRLALYIEESLYRGTQWVVFEPNDEPLWAQIRLNVGAFMQNLFRQGAFQGTSPRDAYFVKCDKETTTQNDINLGIVNILVGFAPLKPAEFVIIKIQQMAGQIGA
jgi:phage tail sheath protein FI